MVNDRDYVDIKFPVSEKVIVELEIKIIFALITYPAHVSDKIFEQCMDFC